MVKNTDSVRISGSLTPKTTGITRKDWAAMGHLGPLAPTAEDYKVVCASLYTLDSFPPIKTHFGRYLVIRATDNTLILHLTLSATR